MGDLKLSLSVSDSAQVALSELCENHEGCPTYKAGHQGQNKPRTKSEPEPSFVGASLPLELVCSLHADEVPAHDVVGKLIAAQEDDH